MYLHLTTRLHLFQYRPSEESHSTSTHLDRTVTGNILICILRLATLTLSLRGLRHHEKLGAPGHYSEEIIYRELRLNDYISSGP